MHELKKDYTLVIVTHNMQQAARVAEMTAFFSLDVKDDGSRARHPRRVRRDREDLHAAVRRAHRGLRHRAVRMRASRSSEELAQLEAALQEEGDLVLRALRSALNALARGDDELADEVIALRRRGRPPLPRDREGRPVAARPPDAGRDRPAARARDPARQPPPRADGRLLRDGREADEADGRPRRRATTRIAQLDRGHGPARRADDPRRARRRSPTATSTKAQIARRARRADRPREPATRSRTCSRSATRRASASTGLRMLVVSRCVERIGDHAVDIGEQIAYLVTGEFREFTDASHPACLTRSDRRTRA